MPVQPPTPQQLSLWGQFRTFLVETNAFALAIAVVIGGAVGKLVTSLVNGVIMPIVGVILPGGEWRQIKIALDSKGNAILVGDVLGAALDFIIVALFVFFVAQKLLRIGTPKK